MSDIVEITSLKETLDEEGYRGIKFDDNYYKYSELIDLLKKYGLKRAKQYQDHYLVYVLKLDGTTVIYKVPLSMNGVIPHYCTIYYKMGEV